MLRLLFCEDLERGRTLFQREQWDERRFNPTLMRTQLDLSMRRQKVSTPSLTSRHEDLSFVTLMDVCMHVGIYLDSRG
jgi:hypothetical protein